MHPLATVAINKQKNVSMHPKSLSTPMAGHLLRVFWLFVGNAVLYASWVAIVLTSARFPSVLDAAAWLAVGLMILARRVDIQRFAGRSAQGEPMTMTDWRRYAAILVGSGAVGGLVAHYLGGSLTT